MVYLFRHTHTHIWFDDFDVSKTYARWKKDYHCMVADFWHGCFVVQSARWITLGHDPGPTLRAALAMPLLVRVPFCSTSMWSNTSWKQNWNGRTSRTHTVTRLRLHHGTWFQVDSCCFAAPCLHVCSACRAKQCPFLVWYLGPRGVDLIKVHSTTTAAKLQTKALLSPPPVHCHGWETKRKLPLGITNFMVGSVKVMSNGIAKLQLTSCLSQGAKGTWILWIVTGLCLNNRSSDGRPMLSHSAMGKRKCVTTTQGPSCRSGKVTRQQLFSLLVF